MSLMMSSSLAMSRSGSGFGLGRGWWTRVLPSSPWETRGSSTEEFSSVRRRSLTTVLDDGLVSGADNRRDGPRTHTLGGEHLHHFLPLATGKQIDPLPPGGGQGIYWFRGSSWVIPMSCLLRGPYKGGCPASGDLRSLPSTGEPFQGRTAGTQSSRAATDAACPIRTVPASTGQGPPKQHQRSDAAATVDQGQLPAAV